MKPAAPSIESPTLVAASTRTHCPYCAFQCGMCVRVDRPDFAPSAVEIMPDPAFPGE